MIMAKIIGRIGVSKAAGTSGIIAMMIKLAGELVQLGCLTLVSPSYSTPKTLALWWANSKDAEQPAHMDSRSSAVVFMLSLVLTVQM